MTIDVMTKAALQISDELDSRVMVFPEGLPEDIEEELVEEKLTLVILGPVFDIKGKRVIRLPIPSTLGLESILNLVSAFLLEQEILREGESFVYVTSKSVGIRTVKKNAFAVNGFFSTSQSVVQRLLEIAIELSVEGREGVPVGTIFVIGDTREVLKHSHQLIPNPFKGHRINVLDKNSKEIIKEFAQLDGAFLISQRGRIVSAGAYLEVDPRELELSLPPGLGSRHIAAAGITKFTKAISISLSESGTIRVFKNGLMLLEYNPRIKY